MITLSNISTSLSQTFQSVHHIREIEKGTFLFQEGLEASELYIIQSGIIQVSKMVEMDESSPFDYALLEILSENYPCFSRQQNICSMGRYMESGKVAVFIKKSWNESLKRTVN